MKVRTLGPGEHEALLDLLDLWELPDGARGRDFFRRYLEQDPSFREENVVAGEEDGRLVACVQIFPRPVRLAGRAVPMGGIGSVFTHPDRRGRGLATRLLEHAVERMRARGMLLSLLFAGVVPLYEKLGWRSWGTQSLLLSRAEGVSPVGPPPSTRIAAFDASRDLGAVRRIHADYSARLDGTVVRDAALWQASLRVAGNPEEEFLVTYREGEILAYARAILLESFLFVSEVGRRPDGAEALAALVDRVLQVRSPDPLARPDRPSSQLRRSAVLPTLRDSRLLEALRSRGIEGRSVEDPTLMWRCLDPAGLARRLGVEVAQRETPEDFLRRVLPPGSASFWPADRF